MTTDDVPAEGPAFGYSRFDGRPIHSDSDREAEEIRATLYSAGFREFDVKADDGSRFSISNTNTETMAALHDPARFAAALSTAGFTVTPDRDDDQAVIAWQTADDETLAAAAFADWGGWRLNPSEATLEHPHLTSWVELTESTNPAEVLDWIAHTIYMQGVDDSTLAGLVRQP